jgi:hypothetical protein
VNDTNLRKSNEIGYIASITTEQAVNCALNLCSAALRHYKVDEIAELSERKQQNLIAMVNRTLKALGIKEITVEWREEVSA